MLIFFLFSLLIKTNFGIIKESSRDHLNDPCNLVNLGCYVFLLHSDQQSSLGCPFGMRRIQCVFNNDQNVFNNQYRVLIEKLNDLDKCCWTSLSFENVYEIVDQSFLNIKLRKRSVDGFFEDIYIIFKKTYRIESNVFEMDSISEDDAQSLYIVFDDLSDFNNEMPRSLKIRNDSFQNLNCKQLRFTNMLSNRFLSLNSKMFYNSNIKQLVITQSNFTGFVIDEYINDDFDVGYLETLLFDNCFLNTKINKNLIGNFYSLENLYILNSGIEIIETDLFDDYSETDDENTIKQFVLDDNLIKRFDLLDSSKLSKLEYLSLNSNPLVEFGKATFFVFSQSLKKLSLYSTNIAKFDQFYPKMPNVVEIILGNNHYINISDVLHLIRNTPKLTFFDLKNTNMVLKNDILNLLEAIDRLLLKTEQNLIKYMDIRSLNEEDGFIEDSDFFNRIKKYEKNAYLNNLLTKTFIRVNQNHPCNCALFFLYKNVFRYEVPSESVTNLFEKIDNYLHKYTNASVEVLLYLPKCLRNLPFENIINEFNTKCNNNIITSTNSIIKKTTTGVITTTLSIPIETPVIITTTNGEIIVTTTTITKDINDDDNIEQKPKLIKLEDAIPFMIAFILFILVSILIIYVKYKIDHKRKFQKSCENTIRSFEQITGTEGSLESSLEINNKNTSSDNIRMTTFWSTFKYHSKKKVKKLNLKRIF
jgi:hypothetical protein